jgi:hypothetical protein
MVGQNDISVYTSPSTLLYVDIGMFPHIQKVIQNQGFPSRMYLKSVHTCILKVQIVDIYSNIKQHSDSPKRQNSPGEQNLVIELHNRNRPLRGNQPLPMQLF